MKKIVQASLLVFPLGLLYLVAGCRPIQDDSALAGSAQPEINTTGIPFSDATLLPEGISGVDGMADAYQLAPEVVGSDSPADPASGLSSVPGLEPMGVPSPGTILPPEDAYVDPADLGSGPSSVPGFEPTGVPSPEATPLPEGIPGVEGVDEFIESIRANATGEVLINIRPETGIPSSLRARGGDLLPSLDGVPPEVKAEAFFDLYGDAFGIQDPSAELQLSEQSTDALGIQSQTYLQMYQDVKVLGAELRVRLDGDNRLVGVNGMFIPITKPLDPVPSLRADVAATIAVEAVQAQVSEKNELIELRADDVTLYVYQEGLLQGLSGPIHLAYEVVVTDGVGSIRELVYVDAHTGQVIDQITAILQISRQVHEHTVDSLVWQEGDEPPSDAEIADLLVDSEKVYNLISALSGGTYLSWDGSDGVMRSVARSAAVKECPNAHWDGVGHATHFCAGTTIDDIVSHEWIHGVTASTHGLLYQYQPGALNESYSDIFGEVVDLLELESSEHESLRIPHGCWVQSNGAVRIDPSMRWVMGEDVANEDASRGLRDLWTPACYGDPGKVSDAAYACGSADSGGVHINSGVPNHAFALLVDGGTYNGITVRGIGLTKAVNVYWRAAEQKYQVSTSRFTEHADALLFACDDFAASGIELPGLSIQSPVPFGSGEVMTPADCDEVVKATNAVELRVAPTQCGLLLRPDAPALCGDLGSKEAILYTDWESLPIPWTAGRREVRSPITFDTADWTVIGNLPGGRIGSGMYVQDNPAFGNCQLDDESGVLFLESPVVEIPDDVSVPRVVFTHTFGTEMSYDGGNIKFRVNGGPWTLLPKSAFDFNGYNGRFASASGNRSNSNPLAGEDAFTGRNANNRIGDWGQSQLNLFGLAQPSDRVQLRFEMGLDGCGGVEGWYVDEVEVYACSAEKIGALCGNSRLDANETCDDDNRVAGDGCSEICLAEDGWTCVPPIPALSGINVVHDGSFEAGRSSGNWTESSSSNFALICSAETCLGRQPDDGLFYVWFGGSPLPTTSSLEQSVVIPATATTLEFSLLVASCDSPDDYLDVTIDDIPVFTTRPCSPEHNYEIQSINIVRFADDQAHTLRIVSQTFAINGGVSNFLLDNIVVSDNLARPGQPSACTRLPENPISLFSSAFEAPTGVETHSALEVTELTSTSVPAFPSITSLSAPK